MNNPLFSNYISFNTPRIMLVKLISSLESK